MQIKRLEIRDHKCLVDFKIRMTIDREKGSSTILIGENGTGKSTMLKTVLEIMMSFDSPAIEEQITYDYEMQYFYKGNDVTIKKNRKSYTIMINDDFSFFGTMKSFKKELLEIKRRITPERINYFYSGANDLTIDIFKRTNINYNNDCRNQIVRYWNTLYLQNHDYNGEFPKRKFNYCDESLVPAYLISILCGNESYEKNCVKEQCHITGIDSVFVDIDIGDLRRRLQNDIVEVGAEGVYDLLDFIDNRFTDLFRNGFIEQDFEHFVFAVDHLDEINAGTISVFNFFEKLLTLLKAELKRKRSIYHTSNRHQFHGIMNPNPS